MARFRLFRDGVYALCLIFAFLAILPVWSYADVSYSVSYTDLDGDKVSGTKYMLAGGTPSQQTVKAWLGCNVPSGDSVPTGQYKLVYTLKRWDPPRN